MLKLEYWERASASAMKGLACLKCLQNEVLGGRVGEYIHGAHSQIDGGEGEVRGLVTPALPQLLSSPENRGSPKSP